MENSQKVAERLLFSSETNLTSKQTLFVRKRTIETGDSSGRDAGYCVIGLVDACSCTAQLSLFQPCEKYMSILKGSLNNS